MKINAIGTPENRFKKTHADIHDRKGCTVPVVDKHYGKEGVCSFCDIPRNEKTFGERFGESEHRLENAEKLELAIEFENLTEAQYRVIYDQASSVLQIGDYHSQQHIDCEGMLYPADDGTSLGQFTDFDARMHHEIQDMRDYCRESLEKAEKEEIILQDSTIEMLREVTR